VLALKGGGTGGKLEEWEGDDELENFADPEMVYQHAAQVSKDIAGLKRDIASVFGDGGHSGEGNGAGDSGDSRRCTAEDLGDDEGDRAGRYEGEEIGGYFLLTPPLLQV